MPRKSEPKPPAPAVVTEKARREKRLAEALRRNLAARKTRTRKAEPARDGAIHHARTEDEQIEWNDIDLKRDDCRRQDYGK